MGEAGAELGGVEPDAHLEESPSLSLWEGLTQGTAPSTMHPSGCARCGAGAGCSVIKYQSLSLGGVAHGRRGCGVRWGGARCPS